MEDIQSSIDARNVHLERVGVTKLALPIMVLEKDGRYQHVTASTSLMAEVPAEVRGAHLSRFVETLTQWADQPVSSREIEVLLDLTRERCRSYSAETVIDFTYFLQKAAPVSGVSGFVDYRCHFRGRLEPEGFDFTLGVTVPVTTLCPCSKAIADAGAHNQRSDITVQVRYGSESFMWLEDLIALIEAEASCPVFPILKRPDEKFVTEAAYGNPKFVEDVVRDVVLALERVDAVTWCAVECESHESIHNHNAFAAAERLFDRGTVIVQEAMELTTGG